MKIDLCWQIAGSAPLVEELRAGLTYGGYSRFRFAVAFARWSGLAPIDAELQAFAANSGNKIEAVVGVDLGGTTVEALTYLSQLPRAAVRILRSGNPRVVFHPKVYLFEGPREWMALIGSGNLTSGGIHSNVEAAFKVTGHVGEMNASAAFIDHLFDGKPPLNSSHVLTLDESLLHQLAAELAPYTSPPPDRGGGTRASAGAIQINNPLPQPGRPPIPALKKSGASKAEIDHPIVAPTQPGTLYLELWDETGSDGAQVQIPKAVLTSYFGAPPGTIAYITLCASGSSYRVGLLQFSNSTFRIQMPFVPSRPRRGNRRAVLKFERTKADEYEVTFRSRGEAEYRTWFSRCTRRTSSASKRYGMY